MTPQVDGLHPRDAETTELIGVSSRFMFNPKSYLFDASCSVVFRRLADAIHLVNRDLTLTVIVMTDEWVCLPFLTLVRMGGLASVLQGRDRGHANWFPATRQLSDWSEPDVPQLDATSQIWDKFHIWEL